MRKRGQIGVARVSWIIACSRPTGRSGQYACASELFDFEYEPVGAGELIALDGAAKEIDL